MAVCRTKLLSYRSTSNPTEASATKAGKKKTNKKNQRLKENEKDDENKPRSKQDVLRWRRTGNLGECRKYGWPGEAAGRTQGKSQHKGVDAFHSESDAVVLWGHFYKSTQEKLIKDCAVLMSEVVGLKDFERGKKLSKYHGRES